MDDKQGYDKQGKEKQNLIDFFATSDVMYDDLSRYILKVQSIDIEKLDHPDFRVVIKLDATGPAYRITAHRVKMVFARAESDTSFTVHLISDTDIPKELERLIKEHKKGE